MGRKFGEQAAWDGFACKIALVGGMSLAVAMGEGDWDGDLAAKFVRREGDGAEIKIPIGSCSHFVGACGCGGGKMP